MLRRLDLRGRAAGEPLELSRPVVDDKGPVEQVRQILAEVAARGDAALRELTKRFDGVEIDALAVSRDEINAALEALPNTLRASLEEAHDAIEAFHRHRSPLPEPYERRGIVISELALPVERAGLYAPGGRAKYPSSVLMTAVPARVAGVETIACCVPPAADGRLPQEVLGAAALAGVDEVYRVGGAQAIAAMAFGTESIKKVDVIVGPGSKWVSIAQREVRGIVGVPGAYAGPSEVVVVADETTPPDWAAIDLVVQAEHGPEGLAWLITWSEATADAIDASLERLVAASPRKAEASATLREGGCLVLVDGPVEAMDVANRIAPEHLELCVDSARELLPLVRHAGAVFLGPLAPASVGDYIAGPSHVLPTAATARFSSVLGVEDFIRRVHAIEVGEAGIALVARDVATIASAEGLAAHAESVLMRIDEPTWSAR